MRKYFVKIIFLTLILTSVLIAHAISAQAAGETPIVNVSFPCSSNLGLGECPPPTDIPGYLNNLYKFAVGIAGLLALAMVVGGGIYYSISTGSGDKQREARSMIVSAIWGVLLLFGSYLILRTVNPQITLLGIGSKDVTGQDIRPISASTLEDQGNKLGSSNCAAFSSMTTFVNSYQRLTSNCSFRKTSAPSSLQIGSGDYYGETLEIPSNSTIWQYPYFIGGQSTSTAKCLIFSYRGPNSSSTNLIKMNESLRLCAPQSQSLSTTAGCNTNDPLPPNSITHEEALRDLAGYGISVTSSGGCSDRCSSNCTSLWGIPASTVTTHLKYLSRNCVGPTGNKCAIIVTGGTEVGHQTHGPGKPIVDLFFSPDLAYYLKNIYKTNVSAVCTASQDSQYRINCNYDEPVRHLHVQFSF
jgi:hypothetical protein